MEVFFIVLIWLLNFAISWWNAYACGKAWAETKAVGGWRRFMVWMGAIMSASGFTWCYLILEAFGAYSANMIDTYWLGITLQLGYVIIIPGVLFAGLMITIDSWARAYRRGGVLNYGLAGYNTYAQVHNTYHAANNFGSALSSIGDAFSGKGRSRSSSSDSKGGGAAALLVLLLAAIAVILGIGTTWLIINRSAATEPLDSFDEMENRRKRFLEGN